MTIKRRSKQVHSVGYGKQFHNGETIAPWGVTEVRERELKTENVKMSSDLNDILHITAFHHPRHVEYWHLCSERRLQLTQTRLVKGIKIQSKPLLV